MKSIKVLSCILLFTLVGCGGVSQNNQVSVQSEVIEDTVIQEELVEETVYAEDELVNRFITGVTIKDISKGNIRTKFFGYIGNCCVEMLNGGNGFSISYKFNTKDGALSEEEIFEVLTNCLKVFGATEGEINQTILDLTENNQGDYMVSNYKTNDNITCLYSPNKELSSGFSYGRIEVLCTSYKL